MATRDGAPIITRRTLTGNGGAYAFTHGPDLRIEFFGNAGRSYPICLFGAHPYPFELCGERFDTPGLFAKMLAGDQSYLEP